MHAPHTRRAGLITAVTLFLLAISGCGYGDKVQHGNIEVYYKDGATKEEADRLGAYLLKTWPAHPGRRSVQLTKNDDGYQVRIVIKKEYQDRQELNQLQFDGARISREVFADAAVEVHACDERFKTLQVFPPRPDVRYSIVDGKAEVFFATVGDRADAQQLAKHLATMLADAPGLTSFKLARRGEVVEVHMVVQKQAVKEPAVIAGLGENRHDLAVNVFQNAVVELHLCDEALNVFQVLKP